MNRAHFSLIAKVNLIVLLILGLAIFFFYYREETREEMAYRRHMQRETKLIADLLIRNASPAKMQSLLDEVYKCWKGILHVQIVDMHGNIIASTQGEKIGYHNPGGQAFSFPIDTPSFKGIMRAYIVPAHVYEEYLKNKAERRNEAILTFIIALAVFTIFTYIIITRYENAFIRKTAERLKEENVLMIEKIKQSERLAVLGRMAASLAHEIRTPLTSIKNLAQLLEEEYADSAFRKDFQEVIINEVERINHIVRTLLSYAKPLNLQKGMIRLDNLLEETLAGLKEAEQMAGVIVKSNLDLIEIEGDRNLLKQVLENMVLNACQAMEGSGTLTINLYREDRNAVISIKDTGVGIKESDKTHIFTPFFTTKAKGTGLGLALCKKILTAHQGKISFDSQEGMGTTFYIYLPIR